MAVKVWYVVLLIVILCSLVCNYQHFSKMLITTYKTTFHNVTKFLDSHRKFFTGLVSQDFMSNFPFGGALTSRSRHISKPQIFTSFSLLWSMSTTMLMCLSLWQVCLQNTRFSFLQQVTPLRNCNIWNQKLLDSRPWRTVNTLLRDFRFLWPQVWG